MANKESSDKASQAAAKLLARLRARKAATKGAPVTITEETAKLLAGSVLSQDETPGKRLARWRLKKRPAKR